MTTKIRGSAHQAESIPLKSIFDIDFATLYKSHAAESIRQPKTPEDWDERADRMRSGSGCTKEGYIDAFLSRMDLNAGDTLLDVGCGGGTVCLAAAPYVQKVIGFDYSPKMLEVLQERADELNISNYQTILKSWNDDWHDVPECDICVSSRSSMVEDLEDALAKLNSKARKAVYMTMTVEKDFINREVLQAIGRDSVGFPTYIYAVNMLYQQGYRVSVDFIETNHQVSTRTITNVEEFITAVEWSIGTLNETERSELKIYYDAHSNEIPKVYSDTRAWAFLSWKTAR